MLISQKYVLARSTSICFFGMQQNATKCNEIHDFIWFPMISYVCVGCPTNLCSLVRNWCWLDQLLFFSSVCSKMQQNAMKYMISYVCVGCPTNLCSLVRNWSWLDQLLFFRRYATKFNKMQWNTWFHMISYDFICLCMLSH